MEIEEIQSLSGSDCGYYYIASDFVFQPQFKYEYTSIVLQFPCFQFILSRKYPMFLLLNQEDGAGAPQTEITLKQIH